MDPATLKGLKEELSKRKVELMASIGEAEEYQRLYNKFPALQRSEPNTSSLATEARNCWASYVPWRQYWQISDVIHDPTPRMAG